MAWMPKKRSRSRIHFVTMCAGTTRIVRPGRRLRRRASAMYMPAMMVLPVPGSSASRKRRRASGSMASKTASSWWANARSGRVAMTAERMRGTSRCIHSAHSAAIADALRPPPSLAARRSAGRSSKLTKASR